MGVFKVQGNDWIITINASSSHDAIMGLGDCVASPTTLPAGLYSRWDDNADDWCPALDIAQGRT